MSICRVLTMLCLPVSVALAEGVAHPATSGGSACVVAKKQGDSLAIEWTVGEQSVPMAVERAKTELHKRGFEHVFPQASSDIPHGWLVVIRTRYQTYTGRIRTSYGCGLSPVSAEQAEYSATLDLRSYSWGWKPEYGYETVATKQF